MKKLIAILLTALLLAIPALAAAPEIQRIEYEGNGFVEVDFRGDVSYDNLAVAVRDFTGAEYAVTVYERDDDDLTFRAENLQPGETYEISLSGIRSGYSGEYETVTAQITAPEAGVPAVKSVDYDAEDRELDIDFVENVDFNDLAIEISDAAGNVYESGLRETDRDSVEVRVKGLTRGETYLLKISGVAPRGTDAFQTIATEFVARGD